MDGFKAEPCAARDNSVPLKGIVNSTRVRSILLLGNASLDNLLRLISAKRCFSHYKKCFFLRQRYPRRRISRSGIAKREGGRDRPKSYFMSVDVRLITARHVSISQKYLPVRPHTALAEEKHASETSYIAAECCEQT